MGISHLFPLLEKSGRPCSLEEFKNRSVAVDSYAWLHRGAYSCAEQLAKGEVTDAPIQYCMKHVRLLLSHKIRPIMVFDGQGLPAKAETDNKRRESRKLAKKQGADLLALGKNEEAIKCFRASISITPEIALALRKECQKINVDCIVAPYEADAQLTFLSREGIVDCVISEDSDLLVFGCTKVLYKMDILGRGVLMESDKLHLSLKMKVEEFTLERFRYIAILAGCDYLSSLPRIGIKKALKFIKMTAETRPEIFLDRISRYLNMPSLVVTEKYKTEFMMADATFKHQIIFDPFQRRSMPLTPISDDINPEYLKNAGKQSDDSEALQMALGNIHPHTKKRIHNFDPDVKVVNEHSIWSKNYHPSSVKSLTAKDLQFKSVQRSFFRLPDTSNKEVETSAIDLGEYYRTTPDVNLSTTKKNKTQSLDENLQDTVENHTTVNPFAKKKISKFLKIEENLSLKPTISKFFNNKENFTEGEKNECDRLSDAENCPEENKTSTSCTEQSLDISNEIMDDIDDNLYCGELPLETLLVEQQSVLDIKLYEPEIEKTASNKRKCSPQIKHSKQKSRKIIGKTKKEPLKQRSLMEMFQTMGKK